MPGGVYAGHGIAPSVHILVAVSAPSVSAPPGNSREFQAHAGFSFASKTAGFFDAQWTRRFDGASVQFLQGYRMERTLCPARGTRSSKAPTFTD